MMDYNTTASLSDQITALIDAGMRQTHATRGQRTYLGASRIGVACERALQYEYADAPVDPGRDIDGRLLRVFERGHVIEDCVAEWLRAAGFDLRTRDNNGNQYGFEALDGRIQGHADGVIVAGPNLGFGSGYPALWECKCLGAKAWRDLAKRRLAVTKPIYAAQIALYQAYLELHEHPALLTAINADTMEVYAELVPFDAALAQRMSDRAVKVITATDAGELLPRSYTDPTNIECRMCQWQDRCWRQP